MEGEYGKLNFEDLWALIIIGILDLPGEKMIELYKEFIENKKQGDA